MLTELINHHCALSFAHFLHDNLLSGLGGDTVKGDRFNLIFDIFAQIECFIFEAGRIQRDLARRLCHLFYDFPAAESIEIATAAINADAYLNFLLVLFLGRSRQRALQRFEDFLTRQGFFVRNGFYNS